jgi:hypothetical protein
MSLRYEIVPPDRSRDKKCVVQVLDENDTVVFTTTEGEWERASDHARN